MENITDIRIKDIEFYIAGYIIDKDTVKYINCESSSDIPIYMSYNQCAYIE